jgi:hypothetical protein
LAHRGPDPVQDPQRLLVLLRKVEPHRRAVRQTLGFGQQRYASLGLERLPLTVRTDGERGQNLLQVDREAERGVRRDHKAIGDAVQGRRELRERPQLAGAILGLGTKEGGDDGSVAAGVELTQVGAHGRCSRAESLQRQALDHRFGCRRVDLLGLHPA